MENDAGAAGRIPADGTLFDGLEGWPEELRAEAALTHYDADATPATRAAWYALECWHGFSVDVTDNEARAQFRVRYGANPRELRRSGGMLLCGPIPAGGAR